MQSQVKTVSPTANVIVLVPSKYDSDACVHQWQAKAYHCLRRLNFIGITSSLPADSANQTGQNICPTKSVLHLHWHAKVNKGSVVYTIDDRKVFLFFIPSLEQTCEIAADIYKYDSHDATLAYERHHLNLRQ